MQTTLTERMKQWAAGRSFWWRLILFLLLLMDTWGPLNTPGDRTIFSGIIFGAHEFGHLFFAFMGEWMGIAGGSLMQLLLPIGAAAVVLRSKDWFGLAVCGLFLAASLGDLSWYIADARAEELDLVSFSPDGAIHDWNYLLARAKMLNLDTGIAQLTRFAGGLVVLASTALALRLCWWMATLKPPTEAETAPT